MSGLTARSGPPAPLGVTPRAGGTSTVVVWAPRAETVAVAPVDGPTTTLTARPDGYHHGQAPLAVGDRYWLELTGDGDTRRRPDPASRRQPDGVHGPSAVDDAAAHVWRDDGWRPPARHELVISEIHVGTFTSAGTFAAAADRLGDLADDGITAVELMPVGAFPGTRNWGYDGVLPWAVQESYGGPVGLRAFVDRAHDAGLAVLLDVVYNHLGPEGNVLHDFGPYFTGRYETPWGQGVNVDGPGSDAVRRYIVDHAATFVRDFHLDGLRLDAVHEIHDRSPRHLLSDLAAAVHAEGRRQRRRVHVIAESDRNDARLVRPQAVGGHGLDVVYDDDFHHALHALLTDESDGYYGDYGTVADLAACIGARYAYTGGYSEFRGRRHGAPAADVRHDRFVVCAQNHDQIGNRARGRRVLESLPAADRRLFRAVLLLSPFVPLLFMGEEHGARTRFPYFVSHSDEDLVDAVRRGRREEFADFDWGDEVADPQAAETFEAAVLDWEERDRGIHAALLALTRELLAVRRDTPAVAGPGPGEVRAGAQEDVLVATMRRGRSAATLVASFDTVAAPVELPAPATAVLVDTADPRWDGPGGGMAVEGCRGRIAPRTAVLLAHDPEAVEARR